MPRLFVAFRPPAAVRARLLALMEGVPDARWQDDGQLHVTLRFIGDVDAHVADDVVATLAGLRASPFSVSIDGVGVFDRRGRIDTLWAGIAPVDPAALLHRKVDQALVRVGLEPERRAYRPHVTLARFSRGATALDGFLSRHAGLASAPFAVQAFSLFESRLGREGASYEEVERYRLG